MCSFFAIHRQKYAQNSGAKVDDPLKVDAKLTTANEITRKLFVKQAKSNLNIICSL